MTFKVFMATGPCQYPLYTVPNEPIPIFFLFTLISLAGISQSSIDSFGTFFILLAADSSADEALDLGGLVEVGEDDTDLEGFEGLLELLGPKYNSSNCTIP